MFEKSRRSFISGARGTYRVRDSSVDISAAAAVAAANQAAASSSSTTSTCGNNNNINVASNGNGISAVVGGGGGGGITHPPPPPTSSSSAPQSSSESTFRHYTGKIGRASGKKLSVNVVFLDDTQHTFEVEKSAKGTVLLEKVFQHLELIEKDYFGLQFDELVAPPDVIYPLSNPHLRWVEASKPLKKQIRFVKPPSYKRTSILSASSTNKSNFLKGRSTTGGPSSSSSTAPSQANAIATVYFRAKFFVEDPSKLHEEYTRYHVYLQIRKDINENRLLVSPQTNCILASYAAQSELGDFDESQHDHEGRYLQRLNIRISGPNLEDVLRKICELHKLHHGQTPADAEFNYLDHIKKLDSYGVSFHKVMDNAGKDIELGVSAAGVSVYHNCLKINTFCWSKITKIAFKRKQFFIQLRREMSEDYDTLLLFNCYSYRSCKNLWKCCVEHHAFFRLRTPPPPNLPALSLFGFGSRFHYTGKTEYQTREDASRSLSRVRRTFFRSHSKRILVNSGIASAGTKSGTEVMDGTSNGNNGCSRRNTMIEVEQQQQWGNAENNKENICQQQPPPHLGTSNNQSSYHNNEMIVSQPNNENVQVYHNHPHHQQQQPYHNGGNNHQLHLHHHHQHTNGNVNGMASLNPHHHQTNGLEAYGIVSLKESKIDAWSMMTNKTTSASNGVGGMVATTNGNGGVGGTVMKGTGERHKLTLPLDSSNNVNTSVNNKNLVKCRYQQEQPRMAWAEQQLSDDEGGFLDSNVNQCHSTSNNSAGVGATSHVINGLDQQQRSAGQAAAIILSAAAAISTPHISKGIAFVDDDENSLSDDGTISIRLEPDIHGKFGFNVKGGYDIGCPVLVSRVAPGTPADQCYPRINEGDQIIQINGKDTSTMVHTDVVNAIRHAASVKKSLILRVRQNVYTADDYEEPPFQYVPDVPILTMGGGRGGSGGPADIQSPLASSMLLLAEAIETDISSQFELLTRKKPELTCDAAKLPENNSKNRYRDISPYDSTRVKLMSCPTGDYINANHIKMEIPASGIVNRYIAAQGPLSSTTGDFWVMIWESQSPLIVMLTSLCERGRMKCFQYWPEQVSSPVVYHNIQVTTVVAKNLSHWIHREFTLKHIQTKEERTVVQLQYESWPDHGCPEDIDSFIRFMDEVKLLRAGSVDPIIVHCSAGIGRTGVLILMETAECLIEANQPVYPLDIVSRMREQRPLMIQTSSQYRFVCEAVLKVYQTGKIRPNPEFCLAPPTSTPLSPLTVPSSGAPSSRNFTSWFTSAKIFN